ncbi:unnamed protein product [Symbiodinium natans]|uniref:Uncharacterized protein n=1 Tax=Symbiodinium natans TaxID=878477 RepID=A0A812UWS2_9DINO|nr:unnamed protein product [Symbiodinium natans]
MAEALGRPAGHRSAFDTAPRPGFVQAWEERFLRVERVVSQVIALQMQADARIDALELFALQTQDWDLLPVVDSIQKRFEVLIEVVGHSLR